MSNSTSVVQVGEEARELPHSQLRYLIIIYTSDVGGGLCINTLTRWGLEMEPFLMSTEKNIISVKPVSLLPWLTDGRFGAVAI